MLVGTTLLTVDAQFVREMGPGDRVLGIASAGILRRIPAGVSALVDRTVSAAVEAFRTVSSLDQSVVTRFFDEAARRLADDEVFSAIQTANEADVASARARGRSTTRLVLNAAMRTGMVESLRMWRDLAPSNADESKIEHDGWQVTEVRAPLGVVGFVFEGRPNVFADATGVLRGGNVVVFRIGSDALATARAIMSSIIEPALRVAGLPAGSVGLLDSPEHAAGWALFADSRLSLAVARGSGEAVSELGSIARQAGTPVSLHGTGGAWIIAGQSVDADRLATVVGHSLDRKVCNTANVVCLPRSRAGDLVPRVLRAADEAASSRGLRARIHAVGDAFEHCGSPATVEVRRAGSTSREPQVTQGSLASLSHEFEWEENPEFHLVLVDSVGDACALFNRHSPQFIVSCISDDASDQELVWSSCNAPFVGDGFTRWVDGQFALLRPELGLSNWQAGRLFARSGILSGDSAYTVRLRMTQADPDIRR